MKDRGYESGVRPVLAIIGGIIGGTLLGFGLVLIRLFFVLSR